jgi:hypothetical protein
MSDFQEALDKFNKDEENKKKEELKNSENIKHDLINNFKNKLNNSIFYSIDKIDNRFAFQYIIIIIVCVYIFGKIKVEGNSLIGLIIAIILIIYINSKRNVFSVTENDDLKLKLNAILPKPKFFQVHPKLIKFFFGIRDFREYSEKPYNAMIIAVDNMAKIEYDINIGIEKCYQVVDIAKKNMYDALNHLQSYIHIIPLAKATTIKLQKAQNILKILLLELMDNIIYNCNKHLEKVESPHRYKYDKIRAYNETNNDLLEFY